MEEILFTEHLYAKISRVRYGNFIRYRTSFVEIENAAMLFLTAPKRYVIIRYKGGLEMDKIILGILMLKRLTAYEIRNIIRQNYSAMCSDSLGSIQVALKKLLEAGFVTCSEFVENGVNKKRYSITDLGRTNFMSWLTTPMDMSKTKNMDMGKLLLMGLVPANERVALLDEILQKLQKELCELLKIFKATEHWDGKNQMLAELKTDTDYWSGIQTVTRQTDMDKNIDDIRYFENMTLQFGIAEAKFQIEWFTKLRDTVAKGGVFHE